MGRLRDLYHSAVGKKALMAASGIVLFGYVLVHMAGNLKLYQGSEKLNAYAAWLRQIGVPLLPESGALWVARVVLLAAVVVHVVAAYQLTRLNRRARPLGYRDRSVVEATYASRTMRWGGVVILLFVVYHLLHLTWGTAHPDFMRPEPVAGGATEYHVYHNVVAGFRIWWVSAFYVVAQIALGLHLYHGVWSLFQSLGMPHQSLQPWRRQVAGVFAVVITLGNISFPIAVLGGWVG